MWLLALFPITCVCAFPERPALLSSTRASPTTSSRLDIVADFPKDAHNPPDYHPRCIVVVGGGIGGLATAYDARHLMRPKDEIIVISDSPIFSFTPSNPWIATRKRQPKDIQLLLHKVLPRHNIEFLLGRVVQLKPKAKELRLQGGAIIDYDYLVIATGPKLGFEEVPGLKKHGVSVCTTPHASHTADVWDALMASPGPVVVGATQEASCFGPAYEYALLLTDEMKRKGGTKLLEKCPITFVTPEPYIGHLGLDGTGESGTILQELMEKNNIPVMKNSRTTKVTKDSVTIERLDAKGNVVETKTLPSKLTMMIPPFYGHNVWKSIPNLTDKNGMIEVNEFQQSDAYPDIFAVGVCVSLPAIGYTTIPIGVPKTGYMIESMGTAAATNIRRMIDVREKSRNPKLNEIDLHSKPIMNGLCIVDFGNDGAIFAAVPQIRPRRHDWTLHSKMVSLAKVAFEKYFLHKIESVDTDPYYEKYMLKLIGVERTKFE